MIKQFPHLDSEVLRTLMQEKAKSAIEDELPVSKWENWQERKAEMLAKSRKKPVDNKSGDYFEETLEWFQKNAPDTVEGINTAMFARMLESLKSDERTATAIHGNSLATPGDSDLILALRLSHGLEDPATRLNQPIEVEERNEGRSGPASPAID